MWLCLFYCLPCRIVWCSCNVLCNEGRIAASYWRCMQGPWRSQFVHLFPQEPFLSVNVWSQNQPFQNSKHLPIGSLSMCQWCGASFRFPNSANWNTSICQIPFFIYFVGALRVTSSVQWSLVVQNTRRAFLYKFLRLLPGHGIFPLNLNC